MLSDLRYRLRALFRRREMERELEDELRFHIEREVEKHLRAGVSQAEAKRRALLEFGGLDRIREEARDARGVQWFDVLVRDARYAVRGLRSRPGFAAAVVITLGLGIGANTAMFGIVDRLLFRSPAYLDASQRVHRVYVSYVWNGSPQTERSLAYRRYQDLRDGTTSFDVVAAFSDRRLPVGTGESAREVMVVAASASFFELFDARPPIGRFWNAGEDRVPAGDRLVVLGWSYWQSAYGGSASVLGRTLHIGEQDFTVIGVAPEGFTGAIEDFVPAMYVPITAFAHMHNDTYWQDYGWDWLEMLVRRSADTPLERADEDLSAAYVRSWQAQRSQNADLPSVETAHPTARLGSILLNRGPMAGPEAGILAWVMGVAIVVLLIACANVVNLLLARAVLRQREIALRLALGVTRLRLVHQLMIETSLIATLGGAVGLPLAQWGGGLLRRFLLPANEAGIVATDGRTLGFTAILCLGLALLTGLAPALQSLRADVAGSLKAGMRDSGYRRSRVRTALLLLQGALSVVLLVGAGLFLRSLSNIRGLRLGYDVEPIVYVDGNLRSIRLSDDEKNALADRLVESALTVPGVAEATLTVSVPFYSSEGRGAPTVEGRDSLAKLGRFETEAGSPRYFETTGTRIVRGRGFRSTDGAGDPPIVVINQAMADALWPNEDPIGRQMRIGSDAHPFLTVVGIAENVRSRRLASDGEFHYYLPAAQYRTHLGASRLSLLVRVKGNGADFVGAVRRQLQQEMPGDAYVSALPMQYLISPQQRAWQFGATMFTAFAGLALVLAAIGLYSVITCAVAQRTRELGVRIALGANAGRVVRLILGEGILFAAAGIAIGGAIALTAARWLQPLLFSVSARDPLVFASVAALLALVSVVACIRPTLRAIRVDPVMALRSD